MQWKTTRKKQLRSVNNETGVVQWFQSELDGISNKNNIIKHQIQPDNLAHMTWILLFILGEVAAMCLFPSVPTLWRWCIQNLRSVPSKPFRTFVWLLLNVCCGRLGRVVFEIQLMETAS